MTTRLSVPIRQSVAVLAAVILCAALPARAQFEAAPTASLDFGLLLKAFGANSNFTAEAELRSLDKDQKEKLSTSLNFAVLDGRVRLEIDTTKLKHASIPAMASEALKEFGLDRVVTLVRPDRKATYIIFSGFKAYINSPMATADLATFNSKTAAKRTALGKETLDGHACTKSKLVVGDDPAKEQEATVWDAADLRGFPIQIQMKDKEESVVLRFSKVQFVRSDAKQFDLPADYTEHKDEKSLMQDVMTQMLKKVTQ